MKEISYGKIIVKAVIAIFLGVFIWGLLTFTVVEIREKSEDYNEAAMIRQCDRYYYKKEFMDLYDILLIYDLYDEKYDVYWEIVNGTIDYENLKMWEKAKEAGVAGSEEKIQSLQQKVIENYKAVRNEKNKKWLEEYIRALTLDVEPTAGNSKSKHGSVIMNQFLFS